VVQLVCTVCMCNKIVTFMQKKLQNNHILREKSIFVEKVLANSTVV